MLGDGTSGAIPTWETITGIAGSGTTNYISNNMNLNAYWSNNITTLPNFLDYAMSVDLSNN
jgi:hypothetical protein